MVRTSVARVSQRWIRMIVWKPNTPPKTVKPAATIKPKRPARLWLIWPKRPKTVWAANVASETKTVSQPTKIRYERNPGNILPFTPKAARESVIVGVLGAVAGAVAGNAIERGATREGAVEILVQLRNGERRSIVQARGGETLYAGDPVVITTTGGRARVTRAPVYAPRS